MAKMVSLLTVVSQLILWTHQNRRGLRSASWAGITGKRHGRSEETCFAVRWRCTWSSQVFLWQSLWASRSGAGFMFMMADFWVALNMGSSGYTQRSLESCSSLPTLLWLLCRPSCLKRLSTKYPKSAAGLRLLTIIATLTLMRTRMKTKTLQMMMATRQLTEIFARTYIKQLTVF